MNIALNFSDLNDFAVAPRLYDVNLDDVRSIFSDVCDELQGFATFVVSGFGQNPWPVDVHTDLLVFLEQLPELVRAVEAGEEASLDFYEQGVERSLMFLPEAQDYKVLCTSRTKWEPNPKEEHIEIAGLRTMLLSVKLGFFANAW